MSRLLVYFKADGLIIALCLGHVRGAATEGEGGSVGLSVEGPGRACAAYVAVLIQPSWVGSGT